MLPPEATQSFAHGHDAAVAACLTELLQTSALPATSLAIAHLALSDGGLGLTAASVTAVPAYWGSWADTLPILSCQAPAMAPALLRQLQHPDVALPAKQPTQQQPASEPMAGNRQHGITTTPEPRCDAPVHAGPPARGWQQPAAAAAALHATHRAEVRRNLPPASQALLDSQSGPYASRVFTTQFLTAPIPPTPPKPFACSCSAGSACHCLCLLGLVVAVALLTLWAAIDRPVHSQGAYAAGAGHSNGQQHEDAEKHGPVRPQTHGLPI